MGYSWEHGDGDGEWSGQLQCFKKEIERQCKPVKSMEGRLAGIEERLASMEGRMQAMLETILHKQEEQGDAKVDRVVTDNSVLSPRRAAQTPAEMVSQEAFVLT